MVSALNFELAIAGGPMSMFRPSAITEPAATSPEITCRSSTRAGSKEVVHQKSLAVPVSSAPLVILFNTFYLSGGDQVTEKGLCVSCEKNKDGM
jgi:hypothetical protein